jgi:hypothetical protein
MWVLLIAILRWCNQKRIEAKLGLSVVAFDLIALIAIEAGIVAVTQSLLNPIVMWVGIGWIVATALVIWWFGGVETDALYLAKIVGLKIGDEFVNALLVFGMIHIWIVSFFMFIPVWQFWPGFAGIIIALMGWGFSAPLAGVKFNWQYVRKAYIAMVMAMVALIILVGAFKSFGKEISAETVRSALQGGLGIWLMGAILLLILGTIPKMPARKLMQWVGVATILIVFFLALAWPSAKKELTAMQKEYGPSKADAALPPKKEPITELACATVIVPAGEIVNTYVFTKADQRVYFYQDQPRKYYIHGKISERPVEEREFSSEFSTSDFIYLRGGPVTTVVTVNKIR